MARGIDRADIFHDDGDRNDFLARLEKATESTSAAIHAWALQLNHVHLLVESGVRTLSHLMRKVLGGYALGFNRRHGRVGYLFQGRFRSILVEAQSYFLELVRYIHLNPLRSHSVGNLDDLALYPWTGHAAILGTHPRSWQTLSMVLNHFGGTVESATDEYLRFVAAAQDLPHQPDLERGRLLHRTDTGVIIVEEALRGREVWTQDERFLGSDDFIDQVSRQLGLGSLFNPSGNMQHQLAELLDEIATEYCLQATEIRAGGRRRQVADARADFSRRDCRELGAPIAEVARHLSVTPRAVHYLAERGERHRLHSGFALSTKPVAI